MQTDVCMAVPMNVWLNIMPDDAKEIINKRSVPYCGSNDNNSTGFSRFILWQLNKPLLKTM